MKLIISQYYKRYNHMVHILYNKYVSSHCGPGTALGNKNEEGKAFIPWGLHFSGGNRR